MCVWVCLFFFTQSHLYKRSPPFPYFPFHRFSLTYHITSDSHSYMNHTNNNNNNNLSILIYIINLIFTTVGCKKFSFLCCWCLSNEREYPWLWIPSTFINPILLNYLHFQAMSQSFVSCNIDRSHTQRRWWQRLFLLILTCFEFWRLLGSEFFNFILLLFKANNNFYD